MIKNIKTGTSSISWATSLFQSNRVADASTQMRVRFLLEFLLLYWWLVLVKLQVVVEQMAERDTPSLKIDIQIFF